MPSILVDHENSSKVIEKVFHSNKFLNDCHRNCSEVGGGIGNWFNWCLFACVYTLRSLSCDGEWRTKLKVFFFLSFFFSSCPYLISRTMPTIEPSIKENCPVDCVCKVCLCIAYCNHQGGFLKEGGVIVCVCILISPAPFAAPTPIAPSFLFFPLLFNVTDRTVDRLSDREREFFIFSFYLLLFLFLFFFLIRYCDGEGAGLL